MLKGRTKIELYNAATGKKVAEQQDENIVTNALKNLLGFGSEMLTSGFEIIQTLNILTPLYPNFVRGLLLWDNTIPENANTIFAPPGVNCVGHAGGGYSGDKATRGTLNLNETEVRDNGVKMVWDFATDKANGVIRSVSLTSQNGGNIGWFTGGESGTQFQTMLMGTTANLKFSDVNIQHYTNNAQYIYLGEFRRGVHTYVANLGGGKLGIVEQSYTNPREVSIFDKAGNINRESATEKLFEIQTDFDFANFNTNCILDENFIFRVIQITNSRPVRMISINLLSKEVVGDRSITLNENISAWGNSYWKNHFYFSSTVRGGVCKFTSDGDFVERIWNVNTSNRHNRFDQYLCIRLSTGLLVTDGNNHNLIPSNSLTAAVSTSYGGMSPSASFAPPAYVSHTDTTGQQNLLYCISPYLATINTLSSQVTKTAQNTMKVTYELTQV